MCRPLPGCVSTTKCTAADDLNVSVIIPLLCVCVCKHYSVCVCAKKSPPVVLSQVFKRVIAILHQKTPVTSLHSIFPLVYRFKLIFFS